MQNVVLQAVVVMSKERQVVSLQCFLGERGARLHVDVRCEAQQDCQVLLRRLDWYSTTSR